MSQIKVSVRVILAVAFTSFVWGTGAGAADETDGAALRWYKGNTHTHSLWSST